MSQSPPFAALPLPQAIHRDQSRRPFREFSAVDAAASTQYRAALASAALAMQAKKIPSVECQDQPLIGFSQFRRGTNYVPHMLAFSLMLRKGEHFYTLCIAIRWLYAPIYLNVEPRSGLKPLEPARTYPSEALISLGFSRIKSLWLPRCTERFCKSAASGK